MRPITILAAALIATPALAQTGTYVRDTVDVTGHGKVSIPPDTATIHYWVRGEGKTADDASRALAADQSRIETGLKGFLGSGAEITNSNLVVVEVRDPNCKTEYGRASLSEGSCAIIGYVASAQADVTTAKVHKAGTAVGLAGRLGARDARLQQFELRDTTSAQQLAMTHAVQDAHEQARVLASAAGGHLGRVLSIRYGSYQASPFVRGTIAPAAPPPPPPPPPPVEINMKPQPQEISADVSVSYELLP